MTRNSLIIASTTIAIALAAILFSIASQQTVSVGKSDRPGGEERETAFLHERFGVPNSQQ